MSACKMGCLYLLFSPSLTRERVASEWIFGDSKSVLEYLTSFSEEKESVFCHFTKCRIIFHQIKNLFLEKLNVRIHSKIYTHSSQPSLLLSSRNETIRPDISSFILAASNKTPILIVTNFWWTVRDTKHRWTTAEIYYSCRRRG